MPNEYLCLNRYKSKLLVIFPLTCSSFSLTFLAGNGICSYSFRKSWGYPWRLFLLHGICSSSANPISLALGFIFWVESMSLLCCSVVPSLYPRGTLGSLFTLFLHFCRLVYTESSKSLLKMCQSTHSCGKMLLIVFFLTRLNLKCYPMESLCTPSSPSL